MTTEDTWEQISTQIRATKLHGQLDTEAIARAERMNEIAAHGLAVDLYTPKTITIDGAPAPVTIHVPSSGWLTTAHPSSSYGIPVLLMGVDADNDNVVYGPADLPDGAMIHIHARLTSDDDTWDSWEQRCTAARAAGYPIE